MGHDAGLEDPLGESELGPHDRLAWAVSPDGKATARSREDYFFSDPWVTVASSIAGRAWIDASASRAPAAASGG